MAPEHDGPHQSQKRRKVAESCKVCRAKKTRCDGRRPACSSCATKSITCEYNDVTVPISLTTLSEIEARLHKLERQASSAEAQATARHTILPHHTDHPPEPPSHPTGDNPRLSIGPHANTPSERALSPGNGVAFTDHTTTQFMQELTQIADARPTVHLRSSLWPKTDAWTTETDTAAMVVPTRAIADDFLDCYERYFFPIFPILHMPTFRESYRQLWQPQRQSQFENLASEATYHATLNIVFALGCLNNSKVEPSLRLRTSDSFYRRARIILPLDALDVPSLGVVQYLLLTTVYLSSTKYSHRCWNTLGMAVRVGQSLGLHTDLESSSNQLRREMSKRVWYHCLTLERLFASIFGRPILLNPQHIVPLPEKIDDEYLREDETGFQPPEIPSLLEALIVTIETFGVIQESNKTDYGSFSRGLDLSELTEVLRLNEKLDQIENNLPAHLKLVNDAKPCTSREKSFRLQAEAVMTRILHTRLVLLRPNVLAAARQTLKSSVPGFLPSRTESALRAEVSTVCIQTAVSAIEMLHENLNSASRILSSIAAFVTLSAATVIIAASLVPALDVSLEGGCGSHGEVISKAIRVLDEHRWQFEGAPAAKHQLEKFLDTVNKAKRLRNDGALASSATPGYRAIAQNSQEPLSSGLGDAFGELDFSDPLWDFQWGGPAPVFDMPGYTF